MSEMDMRDKIMKIQTFRDFKQQMDQFFKNRPSESPVRVKLLQNLDFFSLFFVSFTRYLK